MNSLGSCLGIDPSEVLSAYQERGLDRLSDAALVRAVAEVISIPRRDRVDSFVLHAQLELAARAALLPRVRPDERDHVRRRMVWIAAAFEAFGPPVTTPAPESEDPDPARVLSRIAAGDADGADAALAACFRRVPAGRLVAALAEAVLPRYATAAHAPILLGQLERDEHGLLPLSLLRAPVRLLADPTLGRIDWTEGLDLDRAADARALEAALASTPALGPPEQGNIPAHLDRAQEFLRADDAVARALGRPDRAATVAVLRVAARSMLHEDRTFAPYLWSHCLTLPLGVLGLVHHCADPARALAIAATHVVSYRVCHGSGELLPSDPFPPASFEVWEERVAEAAGHRDAHVAKYADACLRAASLDPAQSGLYAAALARLLEVWRGRDSEGPDPLRTQ